MVVGNGNFYGEKINKNFVIVSSMVGELSNKSWWIFRGIFLIAERTLNKLKLKWIWINKMGN